MLFMSSPINALLEGLYRDDITIATLKTKGDFGIGTFNNLDGELIALQGNYYRIDLDGDAHLAQPEIKTPFATVCPFQPMLAEEIRQTMTHEAFMLQLGDLLPSDNMFYAIYMEGRFKHVKTRSVPWTENYRPLSEATDHQKIRHFEDVRGHLIGFYTPGFVPSVNVPGYHFHFINETMSAGGHVLTCEPASIHIQLQIFHSMELHLPMTLDYLTATFTRDAVKDLHKAER
jgi:acetolactate decarboxylase